VIEVQLSARENAAAILARVAIAGIYVEATEAHVALRHAIIGDQQDNARHPHGAVDETDGLVVDRAREGRPALEVEGLILLVHRAGNTLVEEGARTPDRGDVDRQIGPVQDQNLRVQYRCGLEEKTSAGSGTFRTLTVVG
jgi:hypothetical protein